MGRNVSGSDRKRRRESPRLALASRRRCLTINTEAGDGFKISLKEDESNRFPAQTSEGADGKKKSEKPNKKKLLFFFPTEMLIPARAERQKSFSFTGNQLKCRCGSGYWAATSQRTTSEKMIPLRVSVSDAAITTTAKKKNTPRDLTKVKIDTT